MTLFGPEPDTPTAAETDDAPNWTETRVGRCDVCVELAYRGTAPRPIGRAYWRRRHDGTDRRYCAGHAHDQRLTERS